MSQLASVEGPAENTSAIQIRLNGKSIQLRAEVTVDEMLSDLCLNREAVVVEVNREVIARALFASKKIEHKAVIEIVHLVGGG